MGSAPRPGAALYASGENAILQMLPSGFRMLESAMNGRRSDLTLAEQAAKGWLTAQGRL